MKPLNNHVLLKKVEISKEDEEKGVKSYSDESGDAFLYEIVDVSDGLDVSIKGKIALVKRFVGLKYDGMLYVPFESLVAIKQ